MKAGGVEKVDGIIKNVDRSVLAEVIIEEADIAKAMQ